MVSSDVRRWTKVQLELHATVCHYKLVSSPHPCIYVCHYPFVLAVSELCFCFFCLFSRAKSSLWDTGCYLQRTYHFSRVLLCLWSQCLKHLKKKKITCSGSLIALKDKKWRLKPFSKFKIAQIALIYLVLINSIFQHCTLSDTLKGLSRTASERKLFVQHPGVLEKCQERLWTEEWAEKETLWHNFHTTKDIIQDWIKNDIVSKNTFENPHFYRMEFMCLHLIFHLVFI